MEDLHIGIPRCIACKRAQGRYEVHQPWVYPIRLCADCLADAKASPLKDLRDWLKKQRPEGFEEPT